MSHCHEALFLDWLQLISASPYVASFLLSFFFFFFGHRIFSIPNCNTCDQKQPFQLLEIYSSVFLSLLVSSFPGKELIYPPRIRCHFWSSQLWSRMGCEEKFWVAQLGKDSITIRSGGQKTGHVVQMAALTVRPVSSSHAEWHHTHCAAGSSYLFIWMNEGQHLVFVFFYCNLIIYSNLCGS